MKINLGELVPALDGWIIAIDEDCDDAIVKIFLPKNLKLNEDEKIYVGLWLASKVTMDYRVFSALIIFQHQKRLCVHPLTLLKAEKEAKIESKIKRREDNFWKVKYKGLAYALALLDLERPVVIRVVPPKDRKKREKLRVLIEGKRITVRGKTYKVGGMLKQINGKKIAPWVYLVKKKHVPKVIKILNQLSASFETYPLLSTPFWVIQNSKLQPS